MAKTRKRRKRVKKISKERKPASPIKLKKVSKRKGSRSLRKKKTLHEAIWLDSISSEVEQMNHPKASCKRRKNLEGYLQKEKRTRKNEQLLNYRKEGVLREEREGSPSWGLDEKERIEKALLELKSGEVSTIKEAATKWRVHYDKIQRRASGRTAMNAKQGPRAVLWQYEEELLSSWMLAMGNAGFPVTQAALKDTVQMILKRGKRQNPFPNGRPSDGWYRCFIRRNPEVNSRKTSIPFWSFNSNPSGQFQDTWCGKFSHLLSTLELQGKPGNIWVLDNIECQGLDHAESPETEWKEEKSLKTTTTISICCNALGQFIPPFISYGGRKKEKSWDPLVGAPAGTESCFTRYGDTTSDSIMDWFSRHFLRYISEQPVVLLHSGCWGQVTFDLFTVAQEHGVHFFRMPPTIPVGESFFESFKKCWEKSCMRWLSQNKGTSKVRRKHLAEILGYTWHEFKSLDHGTMSFGRYGIYPPCQDAFIEVTNPDLKVGIGSKGGVITEAVARLDGRVGTSGRVIEDNAFLQDNNVVEIVTVSTEGYLITDGNIAKESRAGHVQHDGVDAGDSHYLRDGDMSQDENIMPGDGTVVQTDGVTRQYDNDESHGASNAQVNGRVPSDDSIDQRDIVQRCTGEQSSNMVIPDGSINPVDTIVEEESVKGGAESVDEDETVIYDGIVVDNYIILDPEGGSENM